MDDGECYSLKIEATEVIKEIGIAVKNVHHSEILESSNEKVYFNMETKEDEKYCVELSLRGFRIAGTKFDVVDQDEDISKYYETIYSLLDSISPGYRNTFGDTLIQKLQGLDSSVTAKGMEHT